MIGMDEIGTLDKRITIMKYADVKDELGLTHQQLVNVFSNRIWARIEPARGKTYYEQYKDKVEMLTKITIRYREKLNENMLIKYQDRIYEITNIVDPYEAHVKLEIMCNLKKRGADDDD